MEVEIRFSIKEKDDRTIIAEDLARRYKVYCREVSRIDLEGKGGFALPGGLQRVHVLFGGDRLQAYASGDKPFVICVDKRNPNPLDKLAAGRFAILLLPSNLPVKFGQIVPFPVVAYDEINIAVEGKFGKGGMEAYKPVACYSSNWKGVMAEGFSFLGGTEVFANPYYTIAKDLDLLVKQHLIKLETGPEPSVIPGLDKSISAKDSVHDVGMIWHPRFKRFMGEIGGIMLFQNIIGENQPEFLAEMLMASFDEIPTYTLEGLLSLVKDQEQRFLGMQEQFKVVQALLEAKMKIPPRKCKCGHTTLDHCAGGTGMCSHVDCPCQQFE